MRTLITILFVAAAAAPAWAQKDGPPPSGPTEHIAWFGTWTAGLEAAKLSGRPIFLLAAAPQCHGISGIW